MVEYNMKKTMTALAIATSLVTLAATAQANNFLVGLLHSATWQPPKCSAPEVLTQLRDRNGNITFRCVKPAAR